MFLTLIVSVAGEPPITASVGIRSNSARVGDADDWSVECTKSIPREGLTIAPV